MGEGTWEIVRNFALEIRKQRNDSKRAPMIHIINKHEYITT